MRLILVLLIFLFQNCYYLDTLGVSPIESVKGNEARDMIVTSAIIGALESNTEIDMILPFLLERTSNINPDLFYKRKEVLDCARRAAIINAYTINIGGFQCDLKPNKIFTDYPVPVI
ncbi:MAG: TIGR04452 family lipoprotein [Leptospiraceae bacterium]|nr:TIGR04452 family lipoprotein [Leptospiraceae bacterium]